MTMAGEPAQAWHPTRVARLRFCTPPHTATAAKLGQVAAPPRTRDFPHARFLMEKTT